MVHMFWAAKYATFGLGLVALALSPTGVGSPFLAIAMCAVGVAMHFVQPIEVGFMNEAEGYVETLIPPLIVVGVEFDEEYGFCAVAKSMWGRAMWDEQTPVARILVPIDTPSVRFCTGVRWKRFGEIAVLREALRKEKKKIDGNT